MTLQERLELLEMNREFEVLKVDEGYYRISFNNLSAYISSKTSTPIYYVTGVYNSGCDEESFDINDLMRLKKFCELFLGKEGK